MLSRLEWNPLGSILAVPVFKGVHLIERSTWKTTATLKPEYPLVISHALVIVNTFLTRQHINLLQRIFIKGANLFRWAPNGQMGVTAGVKESKGNNSAWIIMWDMISMTSVARCNYQWPVMGLSWSPCGDSLAMVRFHPFHIVVAMQLVSTEQFFINMV